MSENKESKECTTSNKHRGHSHGLMMVLCLIPMGILMYFLYSDSTNIGESPWYLVLLVVCPIMHLFMMRGMHGHNHRDSEQVNKSTDE